MVIGGERLKVEAEMFSSVSQLSFSAGRFSSTLSTVIRTHNKARFL